MDIYTIKKIGWRKENKEGVPYKTKMGKPFVMCFLTLAEKADSASACIFDLDHPAYTWREGQRVELELEKKGDYLNFRVPSRLDRLEAEVKRLASIVDKHFPTPVTTAPAVPATPTPHPGAPTVPPVNYESSISPSDLPF